MAQLLFCKTSFFPFLCFFLVDFNELLYFFAVLYDLFGNERFEFSRGTPFFQNLFSESEDESGSSDGGLSGENESDDVSSGGDILNSEEQNEASATTQFRDYPPESELTAQKDDDEEPMSVRLLFGGKVISGMSLENLVRIPHSLWRHEVAMCRI